LTAELAEPPKLKPRYSVVVPVYNEAANIGAFCAQARAKLPPGYELLICYDFDEDNTLPALEQLPRDAKPPLVRLVRNRLGRGVRFAIEAGMKAAEADVVLVTMADLSDDFSNVEEMVRRAEKGADVVCASRYMPGGRQIGGPLLKKLMSRTAGLTLKIFGGMPTYDPTNSFKAYRRSFLQRTPIESEEGFCLGLELTVKAHFNGGLVEEVPALWQDRTAGDSRFQMKKWIPLYLHWYFWAMKRQWLTWRTPVFPLTFLLAAFLLALTVFVPRGDRYNGGDLDLSWGMVLQWAHLHHAQFGKDIVFTYGPLGFILQGYDPQTYSCAVAGMGLVAAAFLFGVMRLARQATDNWWLRAAWTVVLIAFVGADIGQVQDVRIFSLTCLALLLYCFGDGLAPSPSTILLVLAMALVGLTKFTSTALEAGVLTVIAIDQIRLRKWPWPLLGFAAGYLVFWFWSGQTLGALWPYLHNSMSVADGYTQGEGISLPTEARDVTWFIICALPMLLSAACVVGSSPGGKARFWAPGAGLALVLMLIFKAGYVRHDQHEIEGTAGLALLGLLIATAVWKRMEHPGWRVAAISAALAPLILTWCSYERFNEVSVPGEMYGAVAQLPSRLQMVLYGREAMNQQYQDNLKLIRQVHPLPPVTGSVDIYPYSQDVALAENMDYRPRPVFQSYVAYTPDLEDLNAQHLRGKDAPDSVLFDIAAIDGLYPSLDDAHSWPELLTHYDLKQTEQSMTLLTRSTEQRSYSFAPLSETEAELGKPLDVPASDDPIWVSIDIHPSFLGRLAQTLDKPPMVGIFVHMLNGANTGYSVVPATARAGFLLSPLIRDRMSFAALIGTNWQTVLQDRKITSLTVAAFTTDGKSAAYEPRCTVKFERLIFPHRDISSVPGIAEYESFQTIIPQLKVVTSNAKLQLLPVSGGGGRSVLFSPAPVGLLATVPAGATHVQVRFGMLDQSFTGLKPGDSPTDGVAFAIVPMNRDEFGRLVGGKPVWGRKLDPYRHPEDRGQQTADVDLGSPSPVGILLATVPGPHRINPYSYWAGVLFH
jgi:glycosyltransferase involved in cell wall biosynthesis